MYYVNNHTQFTYSLLSEYATDMQVMAPGDVYSFGIILLQMFTRRRPTDDMFQDGLTIVSFVEASLPDHISEIVDVWLKEEMDDFGDQTESTVTAMYCVQSVLTAMDFIQLSLIFIQVCVQNKMAFIDVGCSLCKLKL
jgi:hypothetical protein